MRFIDRLLKAFRWTLQSVVTNLRETSMQIHEWRCWLSVWPLVISWCSLFPCCLIALRRTFSNVSFFFYPRFAVHAFAAILWTLRSDICFPNEALVCIIVARFRRTTAQKAAEVNGSVARCHGEVLNARWREPQRVAE